jgi:hypothetical protein
MVNTYQLVNPYITGTMKTKLKARNSLEAGNMFYKNLSEHFNTSVPSFHFTIHKGQSGGGEHYHFKVTETQKNNEVSFSVAPYTIANHDNVVAEFKNHLAEFKGKFENQEGGKKKKSRRSKSKSKSRRSRSMYSDSDSDLDISSDDIYKRVQRTIPLTQPISTWWYDPYVYNLDTYFMPNLYAYTAPLFFLKASKPAATTTSIGTST